MKKILILILILMLFVSLTSQIIFVPLNHPIYSYLEHLEVKGALKNLAISTKPISRKYVINVLSEIDKNKLNSIELKEFEKHINEFSYSKNEKNHLVEYKYKGAEICFDPVFQIAYDLNKSNEANEEKDGKRYQGGGKIFGSFSDKVGFYFNGSNNLEKGNIREIKNLDNEEQGIGEFSEGKYYSQVDAYLSLSTKFVDFIFGRFSNYWGCGKTGSLTLSNNAPSYNQFMMKLDYFDKIKFTYFHGKLFSDEIDTNLSYDVHYDYENGDTVLFSRNFYKTKYLAAHRLEIFPLHNLKFAFNELTYYGEREFDWSYLNPIMFFWAAKNYTKDSDNLQISMDCEWQPFDKVKLYGTLFIDELKLSVIFDKEKHHNWVAGQIGIYLVEPLIENLDFRLEYTALNPWVYTHKFPTCTAENNNYVMGYWTGQNADNLYLSADYKVSPCLKTKIAFSHYRKGGITEVYPHIDENYVAKKFLDDHQYTRGAIIFKTDYNIWKKLLLSLKYQYTDFELNEDNYDNSEYLAEYYTKDFHKHKVSFVIKYGTNK